MAFVLRYKSAIRSSVPEKFSEQEILTPVTTKKISGRLILQPVCVEAETHYYLG